MEAFLQDLVHWMRALSPLGIYAVILAIAYGENVLPPIPGDVAVVFGGYLAGLGLVSLPLIVVLAGVGGTLGFMSVYAIGYRVGDAIFEREYLRVLPLERLEQARGWVRRWGYYIVLANRFLSGARSVISLAVGISKMDARWTLLCSAISSFVWCALIAYAGYIFGANWPLVSEYLQRYGQAVLLVIGLLVLVQLGRWLYHRLN